MVNWQHARQQHWGALRFGDVTLETDGEQHIFEVKVYLNELDPGAVRVELYAEGVMGGAPVRQEMKRVQQLDETNGYAYRASVPATRAATDYTARLIPQHDNVVVPLENAYIVW